MGFWHSLSKIVSAGSKLDPVSALLRKQGGAAGTVGAILNPGAAAADKMAAGAPINARTMLDPNGWVAPPPPPPEALPEPLPPLSGTTATNVLPPGLRPRAVPYSSAPPDAGLLTQLAYRMAGSPPPNPPGARPYPGMPQAPQLPQAPMSGVSGQIDVRIPPMPLGPQAQGLPMTDPRTILMQQMLRQQMQREMYG